MNKKSKKKSVKKKKNIDKSLESLLTYPCQGWGYYLNGEFKPLSKAEIKEFERLNKEQKIAELKEQKRRAKKITMTVGEYEDSLNDRYRNNW